MEKNYLTILLFAVAAVLIGFSLEKFFTATIPTEVVTPKLVNSVSYSCDSGKNIGADFYDSQTKQTVVSGQQPKPTGSVELSLSDGRKLNLPQTISADGNRYANTDETFVFWGKGNGATVLENNQEKNYIGCIRVAKDEADKNLSQVYSSSSQRFSIRYSTGYTVDESYKYQALGPGKTITGIKFTIPKDVASGTNLSSDSYISIEQISNSANCSATPFVFAGTKEKVFVDADTTYSVASTSDAGAGNRYEETVYVLPGTNPCVAVRYFIHYSAFENFPAGTVKQFDKASLLSQFDQIRRSLIINQ